MANNTPRFKNSVFNKRAKKKPRITVKSSGRARPDEKTPIANKGAKGTKRQKIVTGFKGLIKERKKRIEGPSN